MKLRDFLELVKRERRKRGISCPSCGGGRVKDLGKGYLCDSCGEEFDAFSGTLFSSSPLGWLFALEFLKKDKKVSAGELSRRAGIERGEALEVVKSLKRNWGKDPLLMGVYHGLGEPKRQVFLWKPFLPLIIFALCALGAGAAVGTVLAGEITGAMPVTVSEALVIDKDAADPVKIEGAARSIETYSDDLTAFTAAAEVATGDKYDIKVYLENKSNQLLYGKLTLDFPEGFKLDVDGVGDIANVTRTGFKTWLFKVKKDAGVGNDDYLKITIQVGDEVPPGFYQITGKIEIVPY